MASKPLGPGPGAYALPPTIGYENHDVRKQRGPQYSFGAPTIIYGEGRVGPGPGAYQVDKLTRYGPSRGLEYSIGARLSVKNKNITPGPDVYAVHEKPIFKGTFAPAYSMGVRTAVRNDTIGPGPSAYLANISPIRPGIPSYSIGVRTGLKERVKSPGPAAYGGIDLNVNRPRAPQYYIGARVGLKGKNVGPGPNYYDLAYYRPGKTGPAYSFGVRHGDYAPPMIVPCDN